MRNAINFRGKQELIHNTLLKGFTTLKRCAELTHCLDSYAVIKKELHERMIASNSTRIYLLTLSVKGFSFCCCRQRQIQKFHGLDPMHFFHGTLGSAGGPGSVT